MPWNEQEAAQVEGLLVQFNGAAEVCAVMKCDVADLDALCLDAFGMTFQTTKETFAAQGRALLRRSLFTQALEGNVKALDMLAREHLGTGTRRKEREGSADADSDVKPGALSVLQGKRKDRRARATG